LHKAVEYGHVEVVRELLNSGADVNARNKWMSTPIHWAASKCLPVECLPKEPSKAPNPRGQNVLERSRRVLELLIYVCPKENCLGDCDVKESHEEKIPRLAARWVCAECWRHPLNRLEAPSVEKVKIFVLMLI